MGKLEGKIALITCVNGGIGLATAKQWTKRVRFYLTGRREPELARAVKEIGRNVTGVQGDVRTLVIWIACSRKSSERKASSILCSGIPEL